MKYCSNSYSYLRWCDVHLPDSVSNSSNFLLIPSGQPTELRRCKQPTACFKRVAEMNSLKILVRLFCFNWYHKKNFVWSEQMWPNMNYKEMLDFNQYQLLSWNTPNPGKCRNCFINVNMTLNKWALIFYAFRLKNLQFTSISFGIMIQSCMRFYYGYIGKVDTVE